MLRHIVFSASSSRGWIENELLKWRRSLRQSGLVFARLATMHQMPSGSFASAQDKIEEMDEEEEEEGEEGVTDFSVILFCAKCLWIILPQVSADEKLTTFFSIAATSIMLWTCSLQFTWCYNRWRVCGRLNKKTLSIWLWLSFTFCYELYWGDLAKMESRTSLFHLHHLRQIVK